MFVQEVSDDVFFWIEVSLKEVLHEGWQQLTCIWWGNCFKDARVIDPEVHNRISWVTQNDLKIVIIPFYSLKDLFSIAYCWKKQQAEIEFQGSWLQWQEIHSTKWNKLPHSESNSPEVNFAIQIDPGWCATVLHLEIIFWIYHDTSIQPILGLKSFFSLWEFNYFVEWIPGPVPGSLVITKQLQSRSWITRWYFLSPSSQYTPLSTLHRDK